MPRDLKLFARGTNEYGEERGEVKAQAADLVVEAMVYGNPVQLRKSMKL